MVSKRCQVSGTGGHGIRIILPMGVAMATQVHGHEAPMGQGRQKTSAHGGPITARPHDPMNDKGCAGTFSTVLLINGVGKDRPYSGEASADVPKGDPQFQQLEK